MLSSRVNTVDKQAAVRRLAFSLEATSTRHNEYNVVGGGWRQNFSGGIRTTIDVALPRPEIIIIIADMQAHDMLLMMLADRLFVGARRRRTTNPK